MHRAGKLVGISAEHVRIVREAGFEVAQEVASTGIVNREKLMQSGLPDVQGDGEWMGHNECDNVVDLLLQRATRRRRLPVKTALNCC